MSKYSKYQDKRNQWKRDNPDKVKNYTLKDKFGITLAEYNCLLEDQSHVCAICDCPETVLDHRSKQVKYLSVDHDHATGRVRGLLCNSCNIALGHFQDNVDSLKAAIDYLESKT